MNLMFKNVNKFILWDLIPGYVELEDQATLQLLYEGEERGQAQRFLIANGDLIVALFTKIEESFSAYDPWATTVKMLSFLQRQYNVTLDETNELLLREFLEESITAWKLKGTRHFLHYMIWKIFGWEVTGMFSRGVLLKTNIANSVLYDNSKPFRDQALLFSKEFFGTSIFGKLQIDVFFDSQFSLKSPVLEKLMRGWCYPIDIVYNNTP